jgi:hypothetical protein
MGDALTQSYRGVRGSHDERRLTTRWSGAKPKTAPAAPPAIDQPSIEIRGRVLAVFSDYDGLWNAVRARVDAMGITRLELDHLSGNQEGYSGKLLGAKQVKKFGKQSLGATLGATCCKLVLVEDPEATAKMLARAKKRRRPVRSAMRLLNGASGPLA